MTEWVKVPGYEHIEVTLEGRVRAAGYAIIRESRWGTKVRYVFQPKEYSPRIHDNGYVRVAIQRDGKRAPIYVHRLVALVFVRGYRIGYHVNHINGIKTDNRPENLEWVPNETNIRHAWKTGLVNLHGENSATSKLSAQQVRAIRKALALGVPSNALAVIARVNHGTINKIRDGVTWQSVQG